ncbi:MAG: GGDEF domain-containing protein [Alphaproteobacteria bacterium]|nr:GGDEF domain-containing protein [Alphaproteobacteria bacterium]
MAGVLLLCVLIGLLGYTFITATTRQLLEAEARMDASQWPKNILHHVSDVEAILSGQSPSAATLDYLEHARAASRIVSLKIFDADGVLKLQSPDNSTDKPESVPQQIASATLGGTLTARASATRLVEVETENGWAYHASSVVPIFDGTRIFGWLAIDIDQTGRHTLLSVMATKISISVSLLLMAVSVFGFWQRNRHRTWAERKLERLAERDQLTGLRNRAAFLKQTERKISGSSKEPHGALILCEAGGAAGIAHQFGQEAEDHLILTTAARLADKVGERGSIAKIGRMSFAIFVDEASDPMDVLTLAKEVTLKLGEDVHWGDQLLVFQANAGIALASSDGTSAEALLRSAELALESARQQGAPGYGFFNPDIAKDTKRRAAVQRAVAAATANQSFRLDYQPVYSFRTGELSGFEALIRLHDDELGFVSPAEFIPVAEQSGLINTIGAWCLAEACRTAAEWPAHLVVAVNLSPSQFLSGSLINDVRQALEAARFPAYRLEVEITEGTLMNDSELVLGQLRLLRDMGVAVALDDFGTGYSSLGYLWKFPFSKLKIDRSFVQALDESASAKGILRSIVKLGHGLGLTVTAEGIETTKQFNTLRDLGCDLAQGYLLDRPARVADLAAIILRNFANGLNSRRGRDSQAARQPAA